MATGLPRRHGQRCRHTATGVVNGATGLVNTATGTGKRARFRPLAASAHRDRHRLSSVERGLGLNVNGNARQRSTAAASHRLARTAPCRSLAGNGPLASGWRRFARR